ncbi:polyprenyl synthetase family protein [Microbacterium aoyamense]|uniref:Polyprenyl synthetase family protein n=1 Tax=Microbacterium aoyamense TaxID=344166 RepID=A0ABP5B8L6_9MICO|nr:polyprenyl synthetase family protein [Microbacterium aoyamense]
MIDPPTRAAIDDAINDAITRLRGRAEALGGGFAALGLAVARASAGGKRLRPALVVAAYEAFGGDSARAHGLYPVAAAFELLHTAFVVHDDVIDHDTVRRGIPNIAGEFRERGAAQGADAAGAALLGDAAAILAGDLLLHEASRLIALADVPADLRARLYALLDDAVYVSAAGELADVENSVTSGTAEASALLETAFNKTAVYSFRAPLAAGAVLAGADADALTVLEEAGGDLGLAFQLVDDLIGAFGSEEQAGRETGGDLREAKQTPLVALARGTTAWPRVSDALAVAHTGPIAIREAQRMLDESGARQQLRGLIDDTLARVRFTADDPTLPTPAGDLLRVLANRVEDRVP